MGTSFINTYPNIISKECCEYFINFFENEDRLGHTYDGSTFTGISKEFKEATDLNLRFNENSKNWSKHQISKHMEMLTYYDKKVKEKFTEYVFDYHKTPDSQWNQFKESEEEIHRLDIELNYNAPLMHRYKPPNEGYHIWHYDWNPKKRRTCMRMCVGMVYLNDVEKGGETEFYHQKLKIKPTQGTLVIWPAYFTHTHRGNPPISNTKYIVNQWLIPKI
jgi:hypothetical protein